MTLHLASEQEKLRLCKLLNTSEQQLDENVHRVREWLKQQHHLPQCTSKMNTLPYPVYVTLYAYCELLICL